jgi:outer membrane protein
MNPAIAKLIGVALFALPALLAAQETNVADPSSTAVGVEAAAVDPASDGEAAKDPEEKLQKVDSKEGETMNSVVDILPKGFVLGAIGITSPDRFSHNEDNFFATPGFLYLGDRFFFLGNRASYALVRGKHLTLNVNARYQAGVLDNEDEPEFYSLNSRVGQLEAGFGLNALTPVGLFTTRINGDVSNKSNGYLADATWFLPYYRNGLLIMPSVGFTWYDSNYSNYYFGGVSAEESNPLIPAFDTGSTTSVNGSLILAYRFNTHWIASGGAIYSRLGSDVEDSPILLSRSETNLFLALAYIWDDGK